MGVITPRRNNMHIILSHKIEEFITGEYTYVLLLI
jgi:hypothetical protein